MNEVELLLFAGVAEKVGSRNVRIELHADATIAELSDAFCQRYADLRQLVQMSRWAVDNEFVDSSFPLEGVLQVALIPPVSGG